MPRKSPVHYIAPSAVSIVPNANNTASDLAVYVARGTKIKVYSPGIKELGMVNETYQEWTLTGRNRRLADATKPYTLYARLSKTNKTDGYLVFSQMKDRNQGVEGEQPDWHDKYNYPTVEGMTDIDGALTDQNYWYIKLGEVGEPKDGQRTLDLDTGILTTDQYNMEWSTNPADMPLRVEIGCTIGDEDAGPTPYVPAGSQLVLMATLMRGWANAAEEESFDHWEISRNTGDADADAAWPDTVRKEAFAESGSITITHVRGDGDDFRGLVAVPFTVTAMRRKVEPEPEPEPEPEENAENTENTEVTENTGEQDNAGESEGQEGGDEQPATYEPIASTSITIYAESAETYEIVLSDRKVVYNASSGTYTPEDGVTIRVRTTDLHGDASDITYGQLETACLSLEYAVGSSGIWTDMDLGGPTEETVITVIPIEVFSTWRDDVYVRLVRDAEASSQGSMSVAIELARQTIAFEEVQQQQDGTREREWIFLRSRSSITFGGASSANPEPFLAPRGQVNPEGIADGSETDKNQDHWVPNGWQMSDPGTDSTWYYVYASYRDWIPASTDPETGEPIAAHWGDFIPARTWHQYNSGGGEGQYISKIMDDVANGVITFLKGIKIGAKRLFGWDEDGNITANKLFLSLEARINEIRSHNNKGSGIFESGWFVTNNHNGHSYLEIDELLVRMKAVFMELEIRKETYSGGNVFYSPAGSIIYRVECYNAQNERLDAETVEVIRPFTAGGRFLALLSEKTGLFSHRETITRQLEVDHSEVAYYRCYLIADDGTVQTRNWWHVGDQARCQTFNRASEKRETTTTDQEDPDFDENTYVQRNMDGNRFFWRLVHRTGSKKLEDGKWYDYVDLANTNAGISYVQGSDVPMAGDAIVCIGNRSDAERMNMIMLEVIGGDAPAIKIYKGINSFSLDGRKYMSVSPKKIQIRAGSIEYISDNGMELPPKLFRGAWKRNYRYHYYDEVSCDGSTWLCVIIDGYHWETEGGEVVDEPAAGAKRPGEGLFSYGTDQQGNTLTDRYYSSAEVGGVTIYEVRNYTTTKPSDDNALWQKEVSAGGSGVRGSFKSRVFARTNTNIATEYYTPTGGEYERPWPGGENPHTYRGVTWHDGVPAGKEILWSSVCTFYGAGGSSEWSTPSPETDTADLDIEFSPSATKPLPPMTGVNDTPPTTPVGTKINGDNTHGSRANGSGSEADWYDTQKDASNTHADWENARWRAERKISNGAYDGEWVITKIKGEDGDGIPGDFKSTAFIRTNVDISNVTPTGGSYSEPWPKSTDGGASWSDGIPDGDAMLWASNCTFYGDGTSSGWSTPRKMTDTQDYDVEFAFEQDPDVQPVEPRDDNRHKSYSPYVGQIWFDPVLDKESLPSGETWSNMVWRAERETINGEVGAWVVTRIKGEKGEIDPSQIPQSWIDEVIDEASKALQEGLSIIISPQVIFVRQDSTGQIDFGNATADVEVFKSDVLQVFSIPSGQSVDSIAAYGKTDSGYDLMEGCASAEAVVNDPSHPIANTLWRVKLTGIENVYNQQTGEYDYAYDNGYIRFKVNATVVTDDTTTPPTTTTKSYWMKVAWYLNRLGNRTTKMWGDIEQTYMSRTEYSLADLEKDQTVNLLRGTQNPQIGATAVDNNLWNNDNSQYLTIETLAETPIAGYNKAFHIGSVSARFSQLGDFWDVKDTYRFSAYVRSIGNTATARIEVRQPFQGGGALSKEFSVGTEWQYVTSVISISNFPSTTDCLFYMGSSSGTVEFLAPTVVDITSPSVIRTDYEGQIESSAEGLTQKYTKAISDATKGLVTQQDFADYEQSASQNLAELRSDMENGYTTKSEFEQTSTEIRMGITAGWKKTYVVNPLATDGSVNIVTSSEIKSDNEFGQVVELANNGGNWQLNSVIDSSYGELTGKTVTWFCIVKAIERRSVSPYNCKLHFGTGANETIGNLHAIVMTATYTSATTPMTIEAVSNLNTSDYKDISYGQQKIGENGWYICWVSATPRNSSTTIIDGGSIYDCGFNSMEGKWQIYYGGIVLGDECPSVDVIRESGNLKRTGIDISNGQIVLDAENTIATGNFVVPRVISESDDMITTIEAGQLIIRSKRNSSHGRFAINSQNEIVLQMYDKNGKLVLNLGGTPNTSIAASWTAVNMRNLGAGMPTPSIANLTANAPGSSSNPCTTMYQLTLGKEFNGTQILKYFYPNEQGGGEVLLDEQKNLDNRYFTNKNMDAPIDTSYYITNGFYVKQNNGVFYRTVNSEGVEVYTCEVYKINTGSNIITQTVQFTS